MNRLFTRTEKALPGAARCFRAPKTYLYDWKASQWGTTSAEAAMDQLLVVTLIFFVFTGLMGWLGSKK